jgi:adenine-specific DNA-methyltransferase
LKQVLSQVKYSIEDYRNFVLQYKETRDREKKRDFEAKIKQIKSDFKTQLFFFSPERRELADFENQLRASESKQFLFGESDEEKAKRFEKETKLKAGIEKKKAAIRQIEENAIYKNAFEWRFEFPEVLDNEGNFLGFDIIIGNPPYIGANELAEKYPVFRNHLSSQKRFKTLYQKWDIYIPFIELSIDITTSGFSALIIPYPFINQTYSKLSREFIIKENNLIEIVDLSTIKVFDEATVNNCIIFFKNEKQTEYAVKISKFKDDKISESHQQQNKIILGNNSIIELESRQTFNFNKTQIKTLGEFCFISKGMVLNADENTAKGQFVKADLISEFETKTFCRKYVEAKNIDRYEINKIRFLEWNTLRVPKLISRPTFQELYECNKILINKIGQLKATYDDNDLLCDQTIRIAVLWKDLTDVQNKSIKNSIKRYSSHSREELENNSSQIELKFIIAILNSRLGSYLIDTIRGKGNIDINPDYLKNLPIPKIEEKDQQPFVALVDQILELKKAGEDTLSLENEIDRLVYRLYDLTDEEIAIVERKV